MSLSAWWSSIIFSFSASSLFRSSILSVSKAVDFSIRSFCSCFNLNSVFFLFVIALFNRWWLRPDLTRKQLFVRLNTCHHLTRFEYICEFWVYLHCQSFTLHNFILPFFEHKFNKSLKLYVLKSVSYISLAITVSYIG